LVFKPYFEGKFVLVLHLFGIFAALGL